MRPVSARRPSGTPEGGRFAPSAHAEAAIRLDDLSRCNVCDGSGALLDGAVCPVCVGAGSLDEHGWDRQTSMVKKATVACGDCEGGITSELAICVTCDGAGTVTDYSLAG